MDLGYCFYSPEALNFCDDLYGSDPKDKNTLINFALTESSSVQEWVAAAALVWAAKVGRSSYEELAVPEQIVDLRMESTEDESVFDGEYYVSVDPDLTDIEVNEEVMGMSVAVLNDALCCEDHELHWLEPAEIDEWKAAIQSLRHRFLAALDRVN
jgi:hypothetical protein